MAKTTLPQFDQDLENAIDRLFIDGASAPASAPGTGESETDTHSVLFPEAAVVGTGLATAGSSPPAWASPPPTVLEAIAAVSPEAATLAEHLATLEAMLLQLEWEPSDRVMHSLLQELQDIESSFPDSSEVRRLVDMAQQILNGLQNLPYDLNQAVLKFLGLASQTLVSVCAMELRCPLNQPPDLKLLERQFMLLQAPPEGLSAMRAEDHRDLGLPPIAIPWDHLGASLIPFNRFAQGYEQLLQQLQRLTALSQEITTRQGKMNNLISDFFLRYLTHYHHLDSGTSPATAHKSGFFRRRGSAARKAAAEHQNQLRLGDCFEELEDMDQSLQQACTALSDHLQKLSSSLHDLQRVILVEVVLFKVAGRIFALPATHLDQVVRWETAQFGHLDGTGARPDINTIDLLSRLNLSDEGFSPGSDALLLKAHDRYGAIRVEEAYGREIIAFTKLDAAEASPLLAGVAGLDGNVLYLLNVDELLQP